MPVQAGNYAELRENWQRYVKKLCIKTKDNTASEYYKHKT